MKLFKRRKRAMFECPYDLESCGYVDTATMILHMKCDECPRYNRGVRPSRGLL